MASVVSKTLSLCVLFTLCFCFCLASNDILLYSKVHLVDTVTVDNGVTNFLFRGNMPKDANNNFAYDELLGMMAKRVQEANSTLSFPKASDVNLFVVSFNSLYNKPDTDIEVKYFAQNPDKGSFVNWSFYHRYKDPNTLTQQQIQDAVANSNLWGPDQIPNRVTTAYEMMHNATTDGRSLVIYVHCETGCDRTGEFCAAYYMQYQQQSFQTSEQYNTVDCGRPPNPGAVNAIEWYCYYLQYEVGIPTTSLGACKRSSAASVLKPRAPSTPQLIYTAVFLTQESKDLVLSNFAPTHPQVYAEHMTISFRPSKEVLANLPWGQNVTLTVIGVGNDDKAQAAVIDSNGVFSSDPITHVTVSTEAGVGPVYSNDLLKKGWDKIDTPFTITGRIGAYFSDHSIVYESPRN